MKQSIRFQRIFREFYSIFILHGLNLDNLEGNDKCMYIRITSYNFY